MSAWGCISAFYLLLPLLKHHFFKLSMRQNKRGAGVFILHKVLPSSHLPSLSTSLFCISHSIKYQSSVSVTFPSPRRSSQSARQKCLRLSLALLVSLSLSIAFISLFCSPCQFRGVCLSFCCHQVPCSGPVPPAASVASVGATLSKCNMLICAALIPYHHLHNQLSFHCNKAAMQNVYPTDL